MDELAAGLNKRKIIEKAVFDELCRYRGVVVGGGDIELCSRKRQSKGWQGRGG